MYRAKGLKRFLDGRMMPLEQKMIKALEKKIKSEVLTQCKPIFTFLLSLFLISFRFR